MSLGAKDLREILLEFRKLLREARAGHFRYPFSGTIEKKISQ